MKIDLYQVDAFADQVFAGNPAAVCPLQEWPDSALLQAIAMENNLSETAFLAPEEDGFRLRWFTPTTEVELCGHATLATAFVLFERLGYDGPEIDFHTRSGRLTVGRQGDSLRMDFPALPPRDCDAPDALLRGLGRQPVEVLVAEDYMAVFAEEDDIRALEPDFRTLRVLEKRGVVATAPGREVDFVSRFFAPGHGIDEDPVTGSAHCELAPYWSEKLGKKRLTARQLSSRGGSLICEAQGERVLLFGRAVLYMKGEVELRGE